MKHDITNLAASVNQRLLNLRDSRKEDFQVILNRFGFARAAAENAEFDLVWPPGGPWKPMEEGHDD